MHRQIRTLFSLGRLGDRTDAELLEWFEVHRAEAETAFEELVARHGPMVLDVCRRVLRDPHDVADAFQATFLVLVRRGGSIRDREAVGGWLHRVALRVALRARSDAAHRREFEHQASAPEVADPLGDDVERAEVRAALHEELDRLPAPQRAALVACYLEGLTHEEAASRLRWPVGTVRSRLARGRDRLRDRLARRGLAPAVVFPAPARRPDLVPVALRNLAAQSMFSHAAGRSLAGTVSAPVAALSEKVIRAMNLRVLRIVAAVALMVAAVGGALSFVPNLAPRLALAAQKPAAAASLVGVVKGTDGKPIAGVTVVGGTLSTTPRREITATDAEGRFVFATKEGERKINYVLAYKEGLAPASKLHNLHNLARQPTPGVDLELVLLKPEPYVGTLRRRDGSPVAGARVDITHTIGRGGRNDSNPIVENIVQDTHLASLFYTTTDADGGFRFPAVPSPQRVGLWASAEGLADYRTETAGGREGAYVSGTEASPARLIMEPEARVKGRVVAGFPGPSVGGLTAALQSAGDSVPFWRSTKTDAAGRFEFDRLPEGGGNVFLTDHPPDGPFTYRAIDNLALHTGKTAEATITLIEGVMVEGKAVEIETGDPVPGVHIGMYGPARPSSGPAIMGTVTDEQGRYRFRLPPGMTRFYASDESWVSHSNDIEIPDDVDAFTVPDLKVKPILPGEPRPSVRPLIAKEVQPFQGIWDFDACESVLWHADLEVIRKSWKWAVLGSRITWLRGGEQPVMLSFKVRLNETPNPDAPNKSPHQIDLTFLDGPDQGKTCQGIYYFERGNLWICTTEPGAKVDRPTKMAMSSDSQTAILILRGPKPIQPAPAGTSAKGRVP